MSNGVVIVPASLVAPNVHLVIGPAVREPMDQPRVAVKPEDDVLVRGEERVVIGVTQAVRMLGLGLQLPQVDHIYNADVQIRQVLAQNRHGGEDLQRWDVAAAGHDDVRSQHRKRPPTCRLRVRYHLERREHLRANDGQRLFGDRDRAGLAWRSSRSPIQWDAHPCRRGHRNRSPRRVQRHDHQLRMSRRVEHATMLSAGDDKRLDVAHIAFGDDRISYGYGEGRRSGPAASGRH
jgi:hypothetical protein